MRRATLRVVVGLLALLAAGSGWHHGDAAAAHASTATPGVALQSIYYYAYRAARPPTSAKLPPLSLTAAVAVLNNDTSTGREGRRRLAIAKLVGGARLVKDPSGALKLRPNKFHQAVQALAGADFGHLLDRLAPLGPSAPRRAKENTAFAALDEGSVTILKSHTSCISQNADCGDPLLKDGSVTINFSFEVSLPFEQVVRAAYPRFWHECDNTFFQDTYAALQQPDHTYARDATGKATPDPHQPTPLTPPGPARHWVLYENFTTVEVSFKNLLDITEKFLDPDTYVLQYTLHESINHTTGTTQEPGGIAVDTGFVKVVRQSPTQTLFAGEKTIRFADPSLNDMALSFIQELCNESMGLGAGAGVCCTPSGG